MASHSMRLAAPGVVKIHVDVPRHSPAAQPVTIGCPFAQGVLHDAGRLVLRGPAGDCALAARPLVRWPDQSVRWALLAFTAPCPGWYTLTTADAAVLPPAESAAWIEQDTEQVRIGNGRVEVTIPLAQKGGGPISSLRCDGRAYIRQPDDLQFMIDDATSLAGEIEDVEVLEASAVRVAVMVSGCHRDQQDRRRLSYRLTVELWAEAPAVRLDYQFFNLEPGAPEQQVHSIQMALRPSMGTAPRHRLLQKHHGLRMKPRMVSTARRVELQADWTRARCYAADRAMLEDTSDYPAYLKAQSLETGDWLGVTAGDDGVYLHLHEMVELRPKRLVADEGVLRAELWPAMAGPLTIPQGRSRRHTLTLAFVAADAPAAEVAGHLRAPLHEGRATIDPTHLRSLGVFDQDRTLTPNQHMRLENYLHRLVGGVTLAAGLFDYGDGADTHYLHSYVRVAKQPLRPGAVRCDNAMRPDCPDAIHAFQPPDPARYEPVWTNNEYDLIHALCAEIIRTGRRDLWPKLRAAVRHQVEVDFVHYSDDPWQHHGSPAHSACHNLASAYPSHLWTQGLLEYYCLTGDRDALDIAIKLGDTIIRNLEDPERSQDFWGFNREIGWALLALVQLEELTDLPRFGRYADQIATYLATYDRSAQATPVNLSSVDPLDEIHHQIAGAFFGYAAMVEAVERHARLTGRRDLRQWLEDLLVKVREAMLAMLWAGRLQDGVRSMLTLGMAIGYELTADRRFLNAGMVMLERFMETTAWVSPPSEVKPVAMIHRGLLRFLHHACDAGLLDRLEYASLANVQPNPKQLNHQQQNGECQQTAHHTAHPGA